MSDIIPASDLRRKYYGDGIITDYVDNILNIVKSEIDKIIDEGGSEIIVEIPTIFEIGQMSLSSAQKHVYYKVYTELKKKQYEAKFRYKGIKSNKQKVFLKVTWLTNKDDSYEKFITEELENLVF